MLHTNINNTEQKNLSITWYFAVTPEKINSLFLEI